MPSFDIVSKVDFQEVDNAVNHAQKEIGQRYDFRGSKCTVEWKAKDQKVSLVADDEYKLGQMVDILQTKFVKRDVPLKNLEYGKVIAGAGTQVRQEIEMLSGIAKDKAKQISKVIKEAKLKVQSQVMDDQVRVTGKKIDDLQEVIQTLKVAKVDIDMQFVNMRD